jgi:DNA helicase HerA-like ATPase
MDLEPGSFYLGGMVEPKSGDRTGDPLVYAGADLTTHGVIVGMTGSGKTGLGVGLLEEALLTGVPCLVIDPKGDMGNLLLNFPQFRPEDFRPWIDEAAANRSGTSPDEAAAAAADAWRSGLASWEIGPDRMIRLGTAAEMTIYTPGSSAGVPLNVVGSLAAPAGGFEDDAETLRDEIGSFVSSLLGLAGVDSDPVSGREHILLANIVEQAWRDGRDLDLAGLIHGVVQPPFRKLGVFELDAFYPAKDRNALAMRLNGLVASPSFSTWLVGPPLDVASMLRAPDGRPRAAILYLAHLSDAERQFVVALVLSKLVTWMRGQSGASDLRALVYMDEVFGFCPPTANPPSKKPMLTIFKQARAFGVGMVLSTQNPVDLDYKAMSNAGTWMVGRLQTENDKKRVLEGLSSAAGTVDVAAFDHLISGLGKRTFVMHTAKGSEPAVFTTRWAMSYLAGPLTREQVSTLMEGVERPAPTATPAAPTTGVAIMPQVAEGVTVAYLDPSAPWAGSVGGVVDGDTLVPVAVATVHLTYKGADGGEDHVDTYEAVIHPLPVAGLDPASVHNVDHDPRDFIDISPVGASYAPVDPLIKNKTYWTGLASSLRDHLVREQRITILAAPDLRLSSRVGESEADFSVRARAAAEDAADAEVAKLTDRYRTRIERARERIAKAERRAAELQVDVSGRRTEEVASVAGDLLGMLLGGRRSSTGLSRAASRRSQTRKTEERLGTAMDSHQEALAEVERLEDELEDAILEITGRWRAAAERIESKEIALARTAVGVEPLQLVWMPT